MSSTVTGVRIVDMPDLGVPTDAGSIVGEQAGSGRFGTVGLRNYLSGHFLPLSGGTMTGNLTISPGSLTIPFTTDTALVLTQTAAVTGEGIVINVASTTSIFEVFQVGGSPVGSITTNGSITAYNTTSDYRLKLTFGQAATSALFDAVPVYDAEMKFGGRHPMFLAHELQMAAPWAVTGTKDAVDANGSPVYQQVDHSSLVPAMWAEIQSLRARLATLEARS